MRVRTTTMRSNTGPLSGLFGSLLMVIIGIVFTIASGFMAGKNNAARERCSYQVEATVVGYDRSESSDSSSAVTPLFEYSYNGESYTSKTGSYSSSFKDKFRSGQTYTIFIDPDDPLELYSEEIAKSDGTFFAIFRWVGVALVVLGIISLVISIIKLVVIGGAVGLALTEAFKKRG